MITMFTMLTEYIINIGVVFLPKAGVGCTESDLIFYCGEHSYGGTLESYTNLPQCGDQRLTDVTCYGCDRNYVDRKCYFHYDPRKQLADSSLKRRRISTCQALILLLNYSKTLM